MRIQDIARLANVSVATVSRVINNNNNVKEETKERINQIIKENNYYPNIIARNLSKNENNRSYSSRYKKLIFCKYNGWNS